MKPTKEFYLYTKILFYAHKDTYLFLQVLPHSLLAIWYSPLLLHSVLPHSSNATYTYNGIGIISFLKDGVLIGSRMLCIKLIFNLSFHQHDLIQCLMVFQHDLVQSYNVWWFSHYHPPFFGLGAHNILEQLLRNIQMLTVTIYYYHLNNNVFLEIVKFEFNQYEYCKGKIIKLNFFLKNHLK
jgi:hypothetical protein